MSAAEKEKDDISPSSDSDLQEHDLSSEASRSPVSSPVCSVVSMKSDRSLKKPIDFSREHLPPEKSSQLRSSPPVSSGESVESGRSIKMSINYSEERFDSDTLKALSNTLKTLFCERYQHVLEGNIQAGSLIPLNKIYTELHIIEAVNGGDNIQNEFSYIEQMLKRGTVTTQIKCNDIFNLVPGQDQSVLAKRVKTVLTKGVAGIGKTVSVQKFVLDWAEGKANEGVSLIFPLTFREINLMRDEKCSLNGLLQQFFLGRIDASSWQATNTSLVIILDGLDECRLPLDFQNNEHLSDASKAASVDVLLTNLIKGNLLPSAKIWITSRPAAADHIPPECVHRITEVRGFSDPQKEEYFRKRVSDQRLANRIIDHLKSLRSLYVMCHIPVFCWIVATVLQQMVVNCGWENLPKSLTQMYTQFLITQLNTKKTKYSENKDSEVKDREIITKLGKLAFEQLEKGNLIFYEEDLAECGIDVREASVYSGVFTQIFREDFGIFQRKAFSFVHLTIQEHLAALYVFLSFQNDKQNILNPEQDPDTLTLFSLLQTAVSKALENKSGHLDLFLRFLMGFSLESNQLLLKDLLEEKSRSPTKINDITDYLKTQIKENPCPVSFVKLFHCLIELNDSSLLDEIQNFLKNKSQNEEQPNEDSLSPELWSALIFLILTSNEKLDVFELVKYGKSDYALLSMIHIIKLSRIARFHNCNITVRGCATLSVILPIMEATSELDLSHNNVKDAGVKVLCTGIHGDTARNKLLSCSGFTDENGLVWDKTTKLLHHYIEILDENHEIKEFYGLQGTTCDIKTLRLKNCSVTSASCDFLASVLSSNSSNLKELDLSQNNIGDSGVKVLSDNLQEPSCKLETLTLNQCGLTEECCAALASVLSSESSCLRELDLSNNDLQDSGVLLLSAGLGNPQCKLQKVMLHNCSITEDGHDALTRAMESNPHLNVLF